MVRSNPVINTVSDNSIIIGLLLSLAAAIGGWPACALAIFLGAAGGLIAAQASGKIDIVEMVSGRGRS